MFLDSGFLHLLVRIFTHVVDKACKVIFLADTAKLDVTTKNSSYAITSGLDGKSVSPKGVIGNFSFAQFAMWNDIHTAGEMLDNSKVVRSLMKGHVDWDISATEDLDDEQTYLPITVDATQL